MTVSTPRPGRSAASIVGRVVAGLVSLGAGIVFVLCGWLVVSSRFGPPQTDMHGYGLIFGSALSTIAALVLAVALPLSFSPRRRRQVYAFSMPFFVIVLGLAIAALVTA
ncbi:hypothetical protein SAMN06295879_1248 [Agreia bicolorata]|uniref:Major facilitator superfamily (MFS) profile domain-containing protein n=1 Tax=Agreia bicolorata TaxID=110935 RepID=A0A1T4XK61_9MICO|nr:hypothetical protein [Agreia bicolorata]SKA89930.1 hypothetical protein SAMN06295879_1248 [Agreia bicolorata]